MALDVEVLLVSGTVLDTEVVLVVVDLAELMILSGI